MAGGPGGPRFVLLEENLARRTESILVLVLEGWLLRGTRSPGESRFRVCLASYARLFDFPTRQSSRSIPASGFILKTKKRLYALRIWLRRQPILSIQHSDQRRHFYFIFAPKPCGRTLGTPAQRSGERFLCADFYSCFNRSCCIPSLPPALREVDLTREQREGQIPTNPHFSYTRLGGYSPRVSPPRSNE
jgi:hypothetical protein